MANGNALAEFLRARRALVQPEDVGIRDPSRRRVPGLRREEVGMLAGMSVDYYTRLEQGRDRHPSPQVLAALAGPLELDHAAVEYLKRLAENVPRRRSAVRTETVRPGMQRMLETFDRSPALIIGRYRDVLAANPLATLLNPGFTAGRNIMRNVFVDPTGREIYRNWDEVAVEAVRTLRVAIGHDLDDPRLTDLIGELSLKSEQFGRLWGRHEVREKTIGYKHFNNPFVGPIALQYESLSINGSAGQTLSVYHADPGSADAQALALLATMAARQPPRRSTPRPPALTRGITGSRHG